MNNTRNKMGTRCLSLVCVLALFQQCHSDIFSAICKLEVLLTEEERLLSGLQKYIDAKKGIGKDVDNHVEKFLLQTQDKLNRRGSDYAENPINALHLLCRAAFEWQHVFDMIWCEECKIDQNAIDFNLTYNVVVKHIGRWPSKSDVYGAANALLRLWSFYNLNLTELLAGEILDTKTDPLSIDDVLLIARYADDTKRFYEEIIWLEELSKRIDVQNDNEKKIKVTRTLAAAYYKYGMFSNAVNVLKAMGTIDHKGLIRDLNFYSSRNDLKNSKTELKQIRKKEDRVYQALCRGNIKSIKSQSKLKCFHRRSKIPIYISREEVVNFFPRVSVFHNVISDEDATILKRAGERLFERSTVKSVNADTYQEVADDYRISQTAWVNETLNPQLQKLTRRVSWITGLETQYKSKQSYSEMFQVLNYGVGGMYHPHIDSLGYTLLDPPNPYETLDIQGAGDRTATFVFYLSEVKAGGATVFPKLKARVPVVKGAAAFWYNLRLNGEIEQKSLHAGCPVLLGSKWISNKWIRETGQVFKRLCGLKQNDIEILPTV